MIGEGGTAVAAKCRWYSENQELVLIEGLFTNGSLPVLEKVVNFTSARHKLILNNIANVSTPNFVTRDVDVKSFQEALGKAIDKREERTGGPNGPLPLDSSREVTFTENGVELNPTIQNDNLLFHDRNNRSIENLMKNLAVNTGAHNTALSLMRSEMDLLDLAIRERV